MSFSRFRRCASMLVVAALGVPLVALHGVAAEAQPGEQIILGKAVAESAHQLPVSQLAAEGSFLGGKQATSDVTDGFVKLVVSRTSFEGTPQAWPASVKLVGSVKAVLVNPNGTPYTGSDNAAGPVTMNWAFSPGSAIEGKHYGLVDTNYDLGVWSGQLAAGTFTIPAGQTESAPVSFWVQRLMDNVPDPTSRWNGDRIFLIQLSNPVGVAVYNDTAAAPAGSRFTTLTADIPVTVKHSYRWPIEYGDYWGYPDNGRNRLGSIIDSRHMDTYSDIEMCYKNPAYQTFSWRDLTGFGEVPRSMWWDEEWPPGLSNLDGAPSRLRNVRSALTIFAADGIASPAGINYHLFLRTVYAYDNPQQAHNVSFTAEPLAVSTSRTTSGTLLDASAKSLAVLNMPGQLNSWVSAWDLSSYYPVRLGPDQWFNAMRYAPSRAGGWMCGFNVRLLYIDRISPRVLSASVPPLTYTSGQLVPITVEFLEPVKVAGGAQLTTVSGPVTVTHAESPETESKTHTFYYEVPASGAVGNWQGLEIKVDYASDLSGLAMPLNDADNVATIDAALTPDPKTTFQSLGFSTPSSGTFLENETINLRLDMKPGDQNQNWLRQPGMTTQKADGTITLNRTFIRSKTSETVYALTMGGTGSAEGSFYTAAIPAISVVNATPNTSLHQDTFELIHDGDWVQTVAEIPVTVGLATVNATSAQFAAGALPPGNALYRGDGTHLVTLAFSPSNATSTTTWSTSNPQVAAIQTQTPTSAVLSLVGEGKVTVSAQVSNGGTPLTTLTSPELLVLPGSSAPTVSFPDSLKTTDSVVGGLAVVTWSENVTLRDPNAVFTVEVFAGKAANPTSVVGAPIYTTTVTGANSAIIPENVLTSAATTSEPNYTARVTTTTTTLPGQRTADVGWIRVWPKPAQVTINPLNSLSVTDATSSLPVSWSLDNWRGGTFALTVAKNGGTPTTISTNPTAASAAIVLGTVPASQLKDTYVIEATARNTGDPAGYEAKDSVVLQVYKAASLRITNEAGTVINTLTLANTYTSGMTFDQVRRLGIGKHVGVDFGADSSSAGAARDQIQWSVTSGDAASVNVLRGEQYQDLDQSQEALSPHEQVLVAGEGDGTAQVTAQHVATGMSAPLTVNVATLRNRLYLFQTADGRQATISYTPGGSTVSTLVTTDPGGKAVVYEPSGIDSDVSAIREEGGKTMVATIVKAALRSGEGRAQAFAAFPINNLHMAEVATLNVTFVNPDGTPYSCVSPCTMTYRGVVFRGGDLTSAGSSVDLPVTVSGGKASIPFDEEEMVTDAAPGMLRIGDTLDFWLEFSTSQAGRGSTVLHVTKIVGLVADGYGTGTVLVPATDQQAPWVAGRGFDYDVPTVGEATVDTADPRVTVGPSTAHPEVKARAYVGLPPGVTELTGVQATITGKGGTVNIGAQGSTITPVTLPGARGRYARVETILSNSLLTSGGVTPGQAGKMALIVTYGSVTATVPGELAITNMVGINPLDHPSYYASAGKLVDLIKSQADHEMLGGVAAGGDKFLKGAVAASKYLNVGQSKPLQFDFAATPDPGLYRGVVSFGVGIGDLNGQEPFKTKVSDIDVEVNYIPSITDLQFPKTMKDIEEAASPVKSKMGVQVSGCFKFELRWDTEKLEWEIFPVGGEWKFAIMTGIELVINFALGPIPALLKFTLSETAGTSMTIDRATGPVAEGTPGHKALDLYNTFDSDLKMEGFAGIGVDAGIISLYVGFKGVISLLIAMKFLTRNYIPPTFSEYVDDMNMNAMGLNKLSGADYTVNGSIGANAKASFLFFSLEGTWTTAKFSHSLGTMGTPRYIDRIHARTTNAPASMIPAATNNSSAPELEWRMAPASRDYLSPSSIAAAAEEEDSFDGVSYGSILGGSNTWGRPTPTYAPGLETNPRPEFGTTRDGYLTTWITDSGVPSINETRAVFEDINGSNNDGPIEPAFDPPTPDSNVVVDGAGASALSAWVRASHPIPDVFDDVAAREAVMGAEIHAGIWDGSKWAVTTLTDNAVGDIAPAVVEREGRGVVAWREIDGTGVTTGGPGGVTLNYNDLSDTLLLRWFNGTSWSAQPLTVYSSRGGVNTVLAHDVTMLNSTTAGVLYVVDASDALTPGRSQVWFAIVDLASGSVTFNARLTDDDAVKANPQLTTALMPDGVTRFVAGWTTWGIDEPADITLRAFDGSGQSWDGMPSVAFGSAVADNLPGTWKFSGSVDPEISKLAVVWPEIGTEIGVVSGKEVTLLVPSIHGVGFFTHGGSVGTVPPRELVSAWGSDAGCDEADVTSFAVSRPSAYVFQARGSFLPTCEGFARGVPFWAARAAEDNAFVLGPVRVPFDEVGPGRTLQVPFTVTNTGVNVMTSVTVKVGSIPVTEPGLSVLPGASHTLVYPLALGSTVADVSYTVEVAHAGSAPDAEAVDGTLELAMVDLEVTSADLVGAYGPTRSVGVVMTNVGTASIPAGYQVKVGLFTTGECAPSSQVAVVSLTPGEVAGLASGVSRTLVWTVPADGIPAGGTRLFVKVWAESSGGAVVEEADTVNNVASVLVPNRVSDNGGRDVLAEVPTVLTEDGASTATVVLTNVSDSSAMPGEVVVTLYDADGRVVKVVKLSELDPLAPGESRTLTVPFGVAGASATAVANGLPKPPPTSPAPPGPSASGSPTPSGPSASASPTPSKPGPNTKAITKVAMPLAKVTMK
ncbi:MAG: hypothetical protein FWD59_06120, partial [Micrococcales bacterium]|nr:hypothetical protein [Micrococcales bacterium]